MDIFIIFGNITLCQDVPEDYSLNMLISKIVSNLNLTEDIPMCITDENKDNIEDISSISDGDHVNLSFKDVSLLTDKEIFSILEKYVQDEGYDNYLNECMLFKLLLDDELLNKDIHLYKFKVFVEYTFRETSSDIKNIIDITGGDSMDRDMSMLCIIAEWIIENPNSERNDLFYSMLDYLLDNGANIKFLNSDYQCDMELSENTECTQFTVFMLACYHNDERLMSYLESRGSDYEEGQVISIYESENEPVREEMWTITEALQK